MRAKQIAVMSVLAALINAGSVLAQGVGVKGGLVFPSFSSDALDFDNHVGWQAGVFFGGNPNGVIGVQGEVNYLQKKASSEVFPDLEATLSYVQIPVLLNIHSPASSADSFKVYGLVGPTFDIKIRESYAGVVLEDITDGFERFDLGGMVGVGIEIGRLILEGRYSRGFRQINKNFQDSVEIKSHSFATLVGVRFN